MAEKNNYYSDQIAKKFGIKWNEKEQKDEDGNVIITSRPKPTLPSTLSAPKQEDIDYNAQKANEIAQRFGAKIPDNKTSRKTTVTLPALNKTPAQIKQSKNLAEGATTYQDTTKQITIKPPMEKMTGDDGQQYEVPTSAKKASNPVDFLLRNFATGTVNMVYNPLATGADIGDTSVKQAANKDGIQYRDDYLNTGKTQPNAIEQKYGTQQKVVEQPKTEPTLFEKEYKQVLANKATTETKSGLSGMKQLAENLNPLDENSTAVERIVGGVAQSLPVMIASSLVGGQLVAGAGLVSGANKGAQLGIQAISQIPFFTSAFSGSYQQARDMGFEGEAASKYAFLSATIETGTENLFLPTGIRKLLGLPMEASENAVKYTLKQYFKDMVKEGGTEALNEPLQALMKQSVFGIDQSAGETAQATMESFIAGALMSGLFSSGSLVSGMKYEVKGTDEATGKFIVETEDGRSELVSPEVLTAYTANTMEKQRLATIENMALLDQMESQQNPEQITEPTIAPQEPTSPVQAFEPETEASVPVKNEAVVEGVSEGVESESIAKSTTKTPQIPTKNEGIKKVATPKPKKAEPSADKVVSSIERLNTTDIGVDPQRFQFKDVTDTKNGVNKTLVDTNTFNQELAGVVTVWRDKSGKDWIVNGHHRLELAKRAGTGDIDARILKETDGISESQARMIGAKQNIAEGTPTIKDAAQIFREANYTLDDMKAEGFSMKTEKIKQGYYAAQLNDRLWNNLVNKSLDDKQGAAIGEAFPKNIEGNEAKQNAVMDYIQEEGSVSDRELREVIDMTRFTDVNYEQQDFLWGTETVMKSNLKEKAKLTARVKATINSDKSTFSKVVNDKKAAKLSDKGNVLNQEANKAELELLENISGIIDFGKNRQGDPINAILNKHANTIQTGTSVSKATEAAIADITALVQQGDYLKLAMQGVQESNDNAQITIGEVQNERVEATTGDNKASDKGSAGEPATAIEGQFDLFGAEETKSAETEGLIETADDFEDAPLLANNAEVAPDKSFIREVVVQYKTLGEDAYDNFAEYKESKTKATLMSSNVASASVKEQAILPNPMRYKTTTNMKDANIGYQRVMADYQGTYNEMLGKLHGKNLLGSDDVATMQILMMRADELYEGLKDEVYIQQASELFNAYEQFASKVGQTMQSFSMVSRLSRRGNEYILEKRITNSRSETQHKTATDFEALLDENLPPEAKVDTTAPDDGMWIQPETGKGVTLPTLSKKGRKQKADVTTEITEIVRGITERQKREPSEARKALNEMPKPRPIYETEEITKLLDVMKKYGAGKQFLDGMRTALTQQAMSTQEIVEAFYDEKARQYVDAVVNPKEKKIPVFTKDTTAKILAEMQRYGVSKKFLRAMEMHLEVAGMTKNEILDMFLAEKGIPHINQIDRASMQYHLDALKETPDNSDEYYAHMHAISDIIMRNAGGNIWKKVASARITAMLFNVKTPGRNEVGNASVAFIFNPIETVASTVADRQMAKTTGKTTLAPTGSWSDFNWLQQVQKDAKDLKTGQNTKPIDGKDVGAYGSIWKPDSFMDKVSRITGFTLSDRRYYGAYINQADLQIERAKAYAKANNLKPIDMEAEIELREYLESRAFELTFNNNTAAAQGLSKAVRWMNKHTPLIKSEDFGLGSVAVAFAKTPMNLVTFMGNRIPIASAVPLVRDILVQKQQGSQTVLQDNQRAIATTIGRQVSGTALVALGALLGAGGFITNGEDDEKVKRLLESQGMTGSYLNLGAFKRFIGLGGDLDVTSGTYHEGDTLVSISWALPIAPFLLLGARIQQARTSGTAKGMVADMLEAFGQSTGDFFELPFMRTLNTLFGNQYSDITIGERFGKVGTDLLISFIPSLVKQAAQASDPTAKKVPYIGEGSLTGAVKAALPVLRGTLPNKIDITGEVIKYYDPSIGSALFNAFINPSYTAKVENNPYVQRILHAYERGDITELPVMKQNYFSTDGTRYDLSDEQHQYFQSEYLKAFARELDGTKATNVAKKAVLAKFPELKNK